jgi:hypothetical protein
MVSIIISEINGWNASYSRRTIVVLMAGATLSGIFTFLKPEICFVILTGVFIWIGLVAGKQSWSEATIDGWAIHGKLALGWIITGKIIATLLITMVHFVILLPVLILTNAVWGIPWKVMGEVLFGFWLTSGLMATLGMLGSLGFGDISEFPRKLFSALFLVVTCIPGLQRCNPVLQILNIVNSGSSGGMLQFIPNLIIIILSLVVAQFCFHREVK